MRINIAIDGPSGAGKSTIAKRLAKKLDILYLDTGAMYRGAAYFAIKNRVDPSNEQAVLSILDSLTMDVVYNNGEQNIIIQGEDVTPYIREHAISMAASTISKIPAVRIKLVELQREIAERSDCVLDGRDIGSYVLPHATYKFFLTADPKERAKRRFIELNQKGQSIEYCKVLTDIENRDYQDSHREFAPLKATDDAVVIDSTILNIEEVISIIMDKICK